ncbi:MAG: aldehyde dehydrogenase family protein [Myxococcota bacterium]
MKNIPERAEHILKVLNARSPILFIGGSGVEAEGSATLQVVSPSDGQHVGRVPGANEKDVDRAVRTAEAAFMTDASELAPADRANLLWKTADLIEHEGDDLAVLLALETGRPVREARSYEVDGAVAVLRYLAGWSTKIAGESHDLGPSLIGYTLREPVPVVGVISSWASPLRALVAKVGSALAVGSTVVIKPHELAPFCALRFVELLHKAGLPAGMVNLVTGFGHVAGEALALHGAVGAIAFTGSIETARRALVASAKSNLKPVHLVLGGKSANIILPDASVQKAVAATWKAIFTGRGTTATAAARLIVHESVYEEAVSIVTERARQIIVGDPLDEHTDLGPLPSEEHLRRFLAYVEQGRREGARLVAGGARDADGAKAGGYFVKPTVFMDVTADMRVAKEEVAGPLLSILRFRKEEEAIAIANGTEYGMATGIWSADVGAAQRLARRVRSGTVWINRYGETDPAMPFGGQRLSGSGRDLGRLGVEALAPPKSIYISTK